MASQATTRALSSHLSLCTRPSNVYYAASAIHMHVHCIAALSTARYPQAISAHGDRGFAAAGEKRGRAVETTRPPPPPLEIGGGGHG
jgi:hypothetical protein